MEYIIDNPETQKTYAQLLLQIPTLKNGVTSETMERMGISYEKNWGVSTVDLKKLATKFERDHLLALKLWNKRWRETMILATLLDEPKKISEEQMDFWIKTADNIEIVEQAVMNLLTESPFAFAKALEWCRGKKLLVKSAGLLMMGRLSITARNSIDEMFEPFFDVLTPLAKDPQLHDIFYRSVCQLARRSHELHAQCVSFAELLQEFTEENAQELGYELHKEITSDYFQSMIRPQGQ
ncbi:MAG: DNA alkylation repair protein [Prolixibacteraceae bacterium]|nr:DNA alkylation repair protein [Prolixibacteraceae bacterium]